MGGTFGEPTFSARQREIPEGERGIGEEVMDPKEQLVQVTNLLTPLVEGTDTNQLDNETPCSDFRVRDLIGHFTFGRFLFAAGMSGDKARGDELLGSMPQQFGDVLGDDHHVTYQDASAQLETAVSGVGDLGETVSLVFGDMPAGVALQMLSGDNLVHCWDLARSTGQEFNPPDDLVEASTEFFQGFITDDRRAGGGFGPEVQVSEDASALDRLLGLCGRTP
ncbi:MAG TPA: TIGR03086 family protein [Acidimicrobiaceae bacterium]|nr:TIGR03086 family protein [Acidimicrobiaceae bacterium]|tara:strand:+ start:53646 stop:54311 length:666 start_codon:yes stop_codon:yes gene_type:complete